MYTLKKPEAEIRLLYPKMMELGLAAALLLIGLIFTFSKRFDSKVVLKRQKMWSFRRKKFRLLNR